MVCKTVIDKDYYYHLAGQVVCPVCAEAAKAGQQRAKPQWVMRGAVYGVGAAVACSIGYAIVVWVTGIELALISILVGYLIGRAVRIGSHGLGGRRCQIIAVLLTYLAITIAYVPLLVRSMAKQAEAKDKAAKAQQPGTAQQPPRIDANRAPVTATNVLFALVVLVAIALAMPFLAIGQGFSGIIGLLIIFFGLSRAWTQTGRDERVLMGPYPVEGAGSSD